MNTEKWLERMTFATYTACSYFLRSVVCKKLLFVAYLQLSLFLLWETKSKIRANDFDYRDFEHFRNVL